MISAWAKAALAALALVQWVGWNCSGILNTSVIEQLSPSQNPSVMGWNKEKSEPLYIAGSERVIIANKAAKPEPTGIPCVGLIEPHGVSVCHEASCKDVGNISGYNGTVRKESSPRNIGVDYSWPVFKTLNYRIVFKKLIEQRRSAAVIDELEFQFLPGKTHGTIATYVDTGFQHLNENIWLFRFNQRIGLSLGSFRSGKSGIGSLFSIPQPFVHDAPLPIKH